jgi:hypothetical protein
LFQSGFFLLKTLMVPSQINEMNTCHFVYYESFYIFPYHFALPMETKTCLQCGTELKGRADKKFCDDQCRTAYNNALKVDSDMVKTINNVLRKNRKILEETIPASDGKIKLHRNKLIDKGFSFNYHTHTYTTKAGAIYIFCYEYGYLLLEGDYVMLVKRNDT